MKVWENYQIRVPTRQHTVGVVQNFGADNFDFHPNMDMFYLLVLFLKKLFSHWGNIGSMGPPWAPGPVLALSFV